jgi:prepilin-type N-terminal cleavage/methylation domain-containing protein
MNSPSRSSEGFSLVETLIALVVLALGILAVSKLFPAVNHGTESSRMLTTASFYAQQSLEDLSSRSWTHADLTAGRHPATGFDSLGTTKQWKRFYQVDVMPAPLDNLKRVAVYVSWNHAGARSVSDTLYVRTEGQ